MFESNKSHEAHSIFPIPMCTEYYTCKNQSACKTVRQLAQVGSEENDLHHMRAEHLYPGAGAKTPQANDGIMETSSAKY